MDLPLADLLMGDLANPKPVMPLWHDAPTRKRVAMRYRERLRSARRFLLDHETASALATLALQHPDVLVAMVARARSPFDRIWIEWPFASLRGEAPEDRPGQEGVLIERLHETLPLYRMTAMRHLNVRSGAYVSHVSMLYDLSGVPGEASDEAKKIVDAHAPIRITHAGEDTQNTTARVLGKSFIYSTAEPDEEEERIRQCTNLARHALTVLTPLVTEGKEDYIANKLRAMKDLPLSSTDPDEIPVEAHLLGIEMGALAGLWRMTLAFLAVLNGRDLLVDEVFMAGSGRRFASGRTVPFLEHRRVTLKIPRPHLVPRVLRYLRSDIPVRRHEVMGHWKERLTSGSTECDHVWVDRTTTRQSCEVCGRRRWWVNEFLRGSAEVGFITKDYVVEKKES